MKCFYCKNESYKEALYYYCPNHKEVSCFLTRKGYFEIEAGLVWIQGKPDISVAYFFKSILIFKDKYKLFSSKEEVDKGISKTITLSNMI